MMVVENPQLTCESLIENLEAVMKGQAPTIRSMLVALVAGGHRIRQECFLEFR